MELNMSDKTDLHVEENEKHILLDHTYDNIQELDNPLPSWWKLTFYVGIAFAFFYIIFYQLMGGPSLEDEFKKEWNGIVVQQEKFNLLNGSFNEVKYQEIVKNDGVKKGLIVFETNCVACHKEKGIGDIGPNLTDDSWLWAKGTPATVYPVVFHGVPQNGMPVWSESITNDEIYQVVSYVQTLHNTNLPGGKAPQGEKVQDEK
jgi:cytochrome c oxidase cbb3-type subunit 3